MNGYFTILKKELLEMNRSRKTLVLIMLFAFVAIASPLLAKLLPEILKNMPATPGLIIDLPEASWRDAIDQLVKNIGQIGMIVLIFLFAGSITEEKNKKTLEMTLTKPISRTSFILGKFSAAILSLKVVTIISFTLFYLYTVSIFGSFSLTSFAWLSLFVLVYEIFLAVLAIFFSTFSKNQIMSVGLSFMTVILAIPLLGYIRKIENYLPGKIFTNYKEIFTNNHISDFLPSVITTIIISVVLIFASIYLFKKQEIER
jgi:ABC-2 type transport system permease protein